MVFDAFSYISIYNEGFQYLYLSDGSTMLISIAVKRCLELCLAPCCQDPDNFFMIKYFVFDSFMKNISLRFC